MCVSDIDCDTYEFSSVYFKIGCRPEFQIDSVCSSGRSRTSGLGDEILDRGGYLLASIYPLS